MVAVAESGSLSGARTIMVDRHVRPADVTRLDIIDSLLEVPRELFFPKPKRALAYIGETVPIANGRFELDPRIFAKMLQALDPSDHDLALIVGSGGGYAAAVMSRLVSTVVALECDEELAAAGSAALAKFETETVVSASGPLEAGWAEYQPYNSILVYGAAAEATPSALTDQLSEGGRIISVVMSGAQGRCMLGVKAGGQIGWRPVFDASAPVLPGLSAAKGFEF